MIKTDNGNRLWKRFKSEAPPQLTALLMSAFQHGAFVAGGFARQLLSNNVHQIFSQSASDIDIFFESESGFKKFFEFINEEAVQNTFQLCGGLTQTIGGHAWETQFLHPSAIQGTFTPKIQLINAQFGKLEDVLKRFDFVNCQVGFNNEITMLDERVPSLEIFHELAVNSWENPLLLSRIGKYVHHHRYESLVEGDRQKLVDWINDTFLMLPETGTLPGFIHLNKDRFASHLRSIVGKRKMFTDEDLLLFFGILKDNISDSGYVTLIDIIKQKQNQSNSCDVPIHVAIASTNGV